MEQTITMSWSNAQLALWERRIATEIRNGSSLLDVLSMLDKLLRTQHGANAIRKSK